jgi:penicillin-binding protein 2
VEGRSSVNVHHHHERRRRALGAYVIVSIFMGILAVSFFRVQVLGSDAWELRSRSNRIRQLPVAAPRGTIYDRNGRIIADNSPGYAITILPGPPDTIRATLERMGEYMEMSEPRIQRLLGFLARYGRQPLPVDTDADFEVVSALEERRTDFPNVYVEMRPRRRYLTGEATGHVLGYLGEITREELDTEEFADDRYQQGMYVGQVGIEKQYESILQGRQGLKYVEVDARQRIIGDFAAFRQDPGESGQDLRLNIDIELQEWIHTIFPDSMRGAVVALNVEDGGILAMYSAPSYDPNAFVGGVDADYWDALNTNQGLPLYNRTVMGLYPPASTWKLAAAAIGLDLGVITPDEVMPVPCTGGISFGNDYRRCWDPDGHGFNNLAEAIGNSCNVYFYQLGLRIGFQPLMRRATEIGFSEKCGVDLPQESRGIFPADPQFYVDRFGERPLENEVLSLSIGQGPNSQTPLKMAQFYVAIARDGSAPTPALAQGQELGAGWALDLQPEDLASIYAGLAAVTAPGGTAHFGTSLEHWQVVGKTGTAQNSRSVLGEAENHAWFVGMAGPWGERPEIVVAVLVEEGASGSGMAAPIMAKTADFYLRKKYGIPIDTIQTYGEHVRVGPVPQWYRERYAPRAGSGG